MSDEPKKHDADCQRGAPLSKQQARYNAPPPVDNAMANAFPSCVS